MKINHKKYGLKTINNGLGKTGEKITVKNFDKNRGKITVKNTENRNDS